MKPARRAQIIEWAENSPVSGLADVIRECLAEIDNLNAQLRESRSRSAYERLPEALEQENTALKQLLTDMANLYMGVYDDGRFYDFGSEEDLENRVNRALGLEALQTKAQEPDDLRVGTWTGFDEPGDPTGE
jgi:hypothetical protein